MILHCSVRRSANILAHCVVRARLSGDARRQVVIQEIPHKVERDCSRGLFVELYALRSGDRRAVTR